MKENIPIYENPLVVINGGRRRMLSRIFQFPGDKLMFQQRPAQKINNIAVTILLALSGFSQISVFAGDCDRECLAGMITQYVDALVEHDPSKLPLADDVRFTENSKALKLGEGLWQTVTAKGEFRHDYLDTEKQIAATHILLREDENQLL